MTDAITVRAEELSTHALTVAAISEAVTEQAGPRSGDAVRAPGLQAYGRLCVLVPSMLGEVQVALTGAVESAADSLADTADRLWATAQAYEAADRRRAEAFADVRR
jgi:Excreted virulence factor EspC, type VII ESX diderm